MPTTAESPALAQRSAQSFNRAAWGVLAWNLAVILWGGYVRATGSGAGCGGHWPLCNGQVVPNARGSATVIEFAHRLSSGIGLVAVFVLAFAARRLFPRGHAARTAAALAALLIVTEALLGAGLVLFDYVAGNASGGRVVYLCLHLVNTQLLLAALVGAAWFAERALQRPVFGFAVATLPVALIVSITGVVAALGDTLFPATSLTAGIREDFAATSALLLRLRLIHPVLAAGAGILFLAAAFSGVKARPGRHTQRYMLWIVVLTIAQLCAGALNVALLAPVWMQILHLLIADLLWIALLAFTFETGAEGRTQDALQES